METFGIDLLLDSQRNNIKTKNDILVIFTHWMLVKNKVKNVGVGDNKVLCEDDRQSELLPTGWNDDENSYKLRYVFDGKIFVFHALKSDNTLLINLLDGKTLKTSSLVLETESIVKSMNGAGIDDYVKDVKVLMEQVDKEIIKSVVNPEKKVAAPVREPETSAPDPLMIGQPRLGRPYPYDPYADPLRDIGRGDLDPFGRGGGSIFQPNYPHMPGGNMPFPGRIPGARYDPVNPFPPRNPNNPDPDHFRPPGPRPDGYDDMFM